MPRKSSTVLSAKFIENAKPPKDRDYAEHPDAACPGLALRVYRTGLKVFLFRTRVNGRLAPRKLGDATGPNAITLMDARRRADATRDKAKAGAPLPRFEAPKPEPDARTFGEIAEDYIVRECPRLARGGDVESMIRRELLPHWRHTPLTELRKRHARELTDAMIESRPVAARKLHETYCRILNWALGHYDDDELGIEVSPFANLKPPTTVAPRARALKDGEIGTLWQAWDEVGYPFGPLQKLLLLTGQRRAEVAGMSWGEVDLDAPAWTIPAERSKSRREHIVPLSPQAVAILRDLPRFADGPFVFSSTSGEKPTSGYSKAKIVTDAALVRLVKSGRARPVEPWRWHDLRRTARTGMAELGVPEIVAERVLNHAPRGLSKVYNVYEYLPEKADALRRWGQKVAAIVTPPPSNVVELAEARA